MTWEHPGSTPKPVTLYMCVVQVNSRRGKKWGRSLHRCSFINGTVILRARTRAGGAAGRASVDTLSAKKWWRRLISDWLHSGGGKMCWIPGASPAAAAAAAAAPHFQPSISLAQWCRTRTTASALRREWAKTFFFFGKGAGAVIEAAHKPPNPPKKGKAGDDSPVESVRRDVLVDELPFPPKVHGAVELWGHQSREKSRVSRGRAKRLVLVSEMNACVPLLIKPADL